MCLNISCDTPWSIDCVGNHTCSLQKSDRICCRNKFISMWTSCYKINFNMSIKQDIINIQLFYCIQNLSLIIYSVQNQIARTLFIKLINYLKILMKISTIKGFWVEISEINLNTSFLQIQANLYDFKEQMFTDLYRSYTDFIVKSIL